MKSWGKKQMRDRKREQEDTMADPPGHPVELCYKPGFPVAEALVGAQVFLQQQRDSAVDVGTNASGKI